MIKRAPVKWFGGKGVFKTKVLPLIPESKIFVDAYGGAGNILFARKPSDIEIYNDLNSRLVNLMRILQDPEKMDRLRKRLMYTLYSREEFRLAIQILQSKTATPEEVAWAFYVGHNQGFAGTTPKTIGNWGRVFTGKMTAWLSLMELIPEWHKRLMRVQIDSRDAIEVIKYWDSPDTTFYLDPPYVAATRKTGVYEVEATDDHHARLVKTILQCQGAVVLSGYPSALYKPLEDAGWEKREFVSTCSAAGKGRGSSLRGAGNVKRLQARIEAVWRNPKAVELCIVTKKAA